MSIVADDVLNEPPHSFFNGMSSAPLVVAIGHEPTAKAKAKVTSTSILKTPEFLVIIIEEVLRFHVKDVAITEHDLLRIDIDKLAPIGRLNGPHYARITDKFSIKRPK